MFTFDSIVIAVGFVASLLTIGVIFKDHVFNGKSIKRRSLYAVGLVIFLASIAYNSYQQWHIFEIEHVKTKALSIYKDFPDAKEVHYDLVGIKSEAYIYEVLIFLEHNKKFFPDAYERSLALTKTYCIPASEGCSKNRKNFYELATIFRQQVLGIYHLN